jgi:hydrogenase/urease accessory protein HupE
VLAEDWRPLFGEHYRSIVSVRTAGGTREYVLGEGASETRLDLAAPSRWHALLLLGIEHILTGFDHLLFLLALLVNQRRLGPVVRIVTAFTIAHSITLSLAALHLVNVPGGVVEPLIAASIVWVALENLFFAGTEWRRLLLALGFGLVHGLGFAGALGELALSGTALAKALLGFNLGVELGQVGCVLVLLPLLVWTSRPAPLARLPQAASVLVALMGGFWFVERVFFS